MEFKDYYEVMGVARDATQDEIKRAYRQKARKFHPDVSKEKNAEARFKEVGEAYEVLKDPEKRAAYDRLGANWKAGQDFQPPPDWNTGFEFTGGGFTDGDAGGFSSPAWQGVHVPPARTFFTRLNSSPLSRSPDGRWPVRKPCMRVSMLPRNLQV